MNITNIILVTENHNGSETNSLMDLLAFIDFAEKESWLSLKELAEDMAVLGRTCGGKRKVDGELFCGGHNTFCKVLCG